MTPDQRQDIKDQIATLKVSLAAAKQNLVFAEDDIQKLEEMLTDI